MQNLELFQAVADRVLGNENRLNMASWANSPHGDPTEDREQNMCNTTACVAGWVCIEGGLSELHKGSDCGWDDCDLCNGYHWLEPSNGWDRAALDALGLDSDERRLMNGLFYSSDERALHVLRRVAREGATLAEAMSEAV